MQSFCDLHTHSTFSDGTFTPTQLALEAEKLGLGAVALTDHNAIDGLDEFTRAAEQLKVEAVCGAEFTTEYEGTELHIVGLFIKKSAYSDVTALFDEFIRRKAESSYRLCEKLTRNGYKVDYDKLLATRPNGYVNRAHIAYKLTEQGYAESIKDAFNKFLLPNGEYYTPPKQYHAFEVTEFIHDIGAISVLAHSFLNINEATLRRFLSECIPHGLCGMETDYSEYDADTVRLARGIADEYGILRSGGSDFHGANKPHINLGTGRGELAVPMDYFKALKAKI